MKKELYGITREDAHDTHSYILEYYLTEAEVQIDGQRRNMYGVEIRKLTPAEEDAVRESDAVTQLTESKELACRYIQLLTDCKVTPTHLTDITMDFIADGFSSVHSENKTISA